MTYEMARQTRSSCRRIERTGKATERSSSSELVAAERRSQGAKGPRLLLEKAARMHDAAAQQKQGHRPIHGTCHFGPSSPPSRSDFSVHFSSASALLQEER